MSQIMANAPRTKLPSRREQLAKWLYENDECEPKQPKPSWEEMAKIQSNDAFHFRKRAAEILKFVDSIS